MIDIQHHPLRSFEQDSLAGILGGGQYLPAASGKA